jgi:hypothetical protein
MLFAVQFVLLLVSVWYGELEFGSAEVSCIGFWVLLGSSSVWMVYCLFCSILIFYLVSVGGVISAPQILRTHC